MARRLVCCPSVGEQGGASFRYFYVDSVNLIVEDVTEKLAPVCENLREQCCLDAFVAYADGSKALDERVQDSLPFEFYKLHSFEVFRNTEELRLKTGSEKVIPYCLLNYYRREYDGTQEHTFFSKAFVTSSHPVGVEHELVLEERTWIKNEEEEFIPETLDKGMTDAEREAQAAALQALEAQEQAMADAEAALAKQEKREKQQRLARQRREDDARYRAGSLHGEDSGSSQGPFVSPNQPSVSSDSSERVREEQVFQDVRVTDDVQSEVYQRYRQFEEEMRANREYLATAYAAGNYASLPGYVPVDDFSAKFESIENETTGFMCQSEELFQAASRLDERGVSYTVVPQRMEDGSVQHSVCFTSDQYNAALSALKDYSFERRMYQERVLPENAYFSAYQLHAMDYGYSHGVDMSYVRDGSLNGNQMYRVMEAGAYGCDMGVVANAQYSPTQMDALNYFMRNGWDTVPVREPGMSGELLAEHIFREEKSHCVDSDCTFFENKGYHAFVSTQGMGNGADFGHKYHEDYRKDLFARSAGLPSLRQNVNDDALNRPAETQPVRDARLVQRQSAPGYFAVPQRVAANTTPHIPYVPVGGGSGSELTAPRVDSSTRTADSTRTAGPSAGPTVSPAHVGGTFTPTGHVGSDGLFRQRHSTVTQSPYVEAVATPAPVHGGGGGNGPKGPNGTKNSNHSQHPLDRLYVRSTFAERSQLRIENFGSRALRTGRRFATSTVRTVSQRLAYSDDSNVLPTAYRAGSEAMFATQVAISLPQMFRFGDGGLSAVTDAMEKSGGVLSHEDAKRLQKAVPLRETSWEQTLQSLQEAHHNAVVEQFGENAARMSVSDVEKQIVACEAAIAQLKQDTAVFHPSVFWAAEGKDGLLNDQLQTVISDNKKLKEEIKALQWKKDRTPEEQKLLDEKLGRKKENEARIRELEGQRPVRKLNAEKNALARENQKLEAKIQKLRNKKNLTEAEKKQLDALVEKYRENSLLIKKKKADIDKYKKPNPKDVKTVKELLLKQKQVAELKKLKDLKLGFDKEIKVLSKQFGKAVQAKERLLSIPGRMVDGLIQKMNQSGDNTMMGLGEASGYAMSFARSPIVRLGRRGVKHIWKKTAPKVKSAFTNVAANQAKKKAAEQVKKGIVNQTKKTVTNQVTRKVGVKGAFTAKRALGRKFGLRAWMKQMARRAIAAAKASAKTAARGFGFFTGTGAAAGGTAATATAATAAGGTAATATGTAAAGTAATGTAAAGVATGGIAFIVIGVILLVVMLLVAFLVIAFIAVVGSSFVLSGDTNVGSDGGNSTVVEERIDLSEYVAILNDCQIALQAEVDAIAAQGNSVNGKAYDNVFYDYSEDSNALQILAMAYIRFGLNLSDMDAVKAYMEQVYQNSNLIDSAESDLYACSNGCVTRKYHCYDKLDDFATNTRKSLYAASDHSDYAYVGPGHEVGCKYTSYSCMEKGHGTYSANGCFQHNDGFGSTSPGDCGNYRTEQQQVTLPSGKKGMVTFYYCLGHCSREHRDYYCNGHSETVCYGEHQDLTITVSTLPYDAVFDADTSFAENGSFVMGDAYQKQFTVTAYCSCHICCHPYDPACTGQPSKTASGTTPKANHTIAVDPDVIPLGTHVWINGREYVAEDIGGAIDGHHIDMYFDSHQEALNWGKRKLTVYRSATVEKDTTEGDAYGFVGWTPDNKAWVEWIYTNMTNESADKVYAGLDGLKGWSFGSYNGDFDFSGIDFGKLDEGSLTSAQKRVLAVIQNNTANTEKGYCQAWVADVYLYAQVGDQRESKCCANHAGEAWGVSKDWSKIQVGATVYGYSSSQYGHVGIYIGNGMVAHNIGYVKVQSLESWVQTYNGVCWGWNGGENLTGNSSYNCKAAGSFMEGKD